MDGHDTDRFARRFTSLDESIAALHRLVLDRTAALVTEIGGARCQVGNPLSLPAARGNGADPETLRRYLEAKDALAKAELAWIAAGLPIVGNVLNDMRSCYGAMLKAHETLLSVAGIGYWRSNGR